MIVFETPAPLGMARYSVGSFLHDMSWEFVHYREAEIFRDEVAGLVIPRVEGMLEKYRGQEATP